MYAYALGARVTTASGSEVFDFRGGGSFDGVEPSRAVEMMLFIFVIQRGATPTGIDLAFTADCLEGWSA